MKDVNPKRLRRGGGVQVRTLRGARVADVTEALHKLDGSTNIAKVVLHVGTNNVAAVEARPKLLDNFVVEYRALVDSIRCKVPDAQIAVSAIPPQKPWKRIITVRKMNERLDDLCKVNGATFLPHAAVWSTDSDGKVDPSVIKDKVHFSPRGLGLYLREVKAFLFGNGKSASKAGMLNQSHASSYADAVSRGLKESKHVKPPSVASEVAPDRDDKQAVRSAEQEVKFHSSVGGGEDRDCANSHHRNLKSPSTHPFPSFNPYLPFCMPNGFNPMSSGFSPFPQMFPWFFGRPPPPSGAGWPTPPYM
jgi:hypothetical protein